MAEIKPGIGGVVPAWLIASLSPRQRRSWPQAKTTREPNLACGDERPFRVIRVGLGPSVDVCLRGNFGLAPDGKGGPKSANICRQQVSKIAAY